MRLDRAMRAMFDNTAAHVLLAREKVWNSLIDFYLMFLTICRGASVFLFYFATLDDLPK